MLKHILTAKCNRKCDYCITRNVKNPKYMPSLTEIRDLYWLMSRDHKEIMLTGGEPTIHIHFREIARLAKSSYFDGVHVTTQNPGLLVDTITSLHLDSITFSIHDMHHFYWNRGRYQVDQNIPVYASIMAESYNPQLLYELRLLGFSGLTINEDNRNPEPFTKEIPKVNKFSVRVNKCGKCITDEFIILPDLQVINNFTEYL